MQKLEHATDLILGKIRTPVTVVYFILFYCKSCQWVKNAPSN